MTENNYYEWAERYLNSRASDNEIDVSNIDESISPTWTGSHTFNSGLSMGGDLDLGGNTLTDSTQSYLDFTGSNDVRLSTGQAIEDGSGTSRVTFRSSDTLIHDEIGNAQSIISSSEGIIEEVDTGNVWKINDKELGGTAVQYDTGLNSGVLRTPNAGARIESDGQKSSGEGLEITYNSSAPNSAITSIDRNTNTKSNLYLNTDILYLSPDGGLVDMSLEPADLRLATGQAIEDGSGASRIDIGSGFTRITDGSNRAITLNSGAANTYYARNGQPWRLSDDESGSVAVEYTTDLNTGTLELTNASLKTSHYIDLRKGGTGTDGGKIKWRDRGGGQQPFIVENGAGGIVAQDDTGNQSTIV